LVILIESIEKLNQNFLEAMKFNYILWPAAAFINYRFIPIQHRIAYISIISLFWGTILSLINNNSKIIQIDKGDKRQLTLE
jgi:protein Mpv17